MGMNELFEDCVNLPQTWAATLGMTYEEINIWIFFILEPIVFVLMSIWIIRLIREQRSLRTQLNEARG